MVAAQEPTVVLPGDGVVNGKLIKPAAWSMMYEGWRAGQSMPAVKLDYSVQATKVNGQDALLFLQVVNLPMGKAIDSVWVHATDLRPLSHRASRPQRKLALDFNGAIIHGAVTPNDGVETPIRATEKQLVFDGGVIDLVLAALPLRDGYRARLPFYIYERGGTAWYSVEVKDAGANWDVRMNDNGTEITQLIDKKTRQLVSGEMYNKGADMRIVLKRP
ncbi:MAG TPA: hypothetical protein VM100_00575 [Longimicrobiales bacterium]|nr:hypothetical protein [Longimicrobiales bacterium]